MNFQAQQWDYLKRSWHLTRREVQVARLVCKGLNHEQIGEKLDIEYNTVRAHLGNICSKVGVRGKAGLIVQFVEVLQRARV